MKIATAAYPLEYLENLEAYERKLRHWVKSAADQGAELLVFPEYGAMELAALAGREAAWDLPGSIRAVSAYLKAADEMHAALAKERGVYILAGSAPCLQQAGAGAVNRARFFAPSGAMGWQDKQIMTRFERDVWGIRPGDALRLFDTDLGRIGVLICYDGEFPLLGRALAEADVILVPSCTEALTGYSRVRIGAMARALENQCVTVMSSTIGVCSWSQSVDENTGAGGIYGPPDIGFPDTGVIAQGDLDAPGWVFGDVSIEAIAHVRRDGGVLNRAHWKEQDGRSAAAPMTPLR